MVPNEAAIFLPFRVFRSPFTMPEPLPAMIAIVASEPSLVALPLIVAERDEVHAAQHGADHRHADLHDFAFTRLQRVERIDAGGIGARDGDIEALLLEETALQRDRQTDLIDAGHHAGLQLHRRLGRAQSAAAPATRPTLSSKRRILILLVAAARRASPSRGGRERQGPLVSPPELRRNCLVSRKPSDTSGIAGHETAPAGTAASPVC